MHLVLHQSHNSQLPIVPNQLIKHCDHYVSSRIQQSNVDFHPLTFLGTHESKGQYVFDC